MSADVAAYIRDWIVSGQVAPGEHLRINDLATRLTVSTTPVREALLVLEKEGFITSERNRGFRVQTLLAEDIRDLFELHALIAGMLAERAAKLLTDSDLKELGDLDKRIRAAAVAGNVDDVEELNYEFHRKINRASPSITLRRFLTETTRYIPRRYYKAIPGWVKRTTHDHLALLAALRRRDGNEARKQTELHIRQAGVLLVGHLTSLGLWSRPSTPPR